MSSTLGQPRAFEDRLRRDTGVRARQGLQHAHTNFIVLAQALAKATNTPYEMLLQQRIIDRLGLGQTRIWTTAELPIHRCTASPRSAGFEDSTYWSPSWTSHTGPAQR